jgi:hypothetical protein
MHNMGFCSILRALGPVNRVPNAALVVTAYFPCIIEENQILNLFFRKHGLITFQLRETETCRQQRFCSQLNFTSTHVKNRHSISF